MIFNITGGGGAGGVGATLTVSAPAGVTVTVAKDDRSYSKTADSSGVATFKGLETGAWTVTITDGENSATKTANINADYSVTITFNKIPEFTYDGDYQIVNDSDEEITTSQDNWKIRLLTSGTLTFTALNGAEDGIDVFCVGGGGGGGTRSNKNYASGGGGGYTTTGDAVPKIKTDYEIVVGAGGEIDADGGRSSAFGVTADGGECGVDGGAGGAGGSGGGAGGVTYDSCYGGSDGSDGATSSKASGGAGQGTTTREFGEETGTLYAGGGGGGYPYGGNNAGGEGGGGNGSTDGGNATAGTVNTGGGGGGGKYGANPAAGGSGIVVIRNKRG